MDKHKIKSKLSDGPKTFDQLRESCDCPTCGCRRDELQPLLHKMHRDGEITMRVDRRWELASAYDDGRHSEKDNNDEINNND